MYLSTMKLFGIKAIPNKICHALMSRGKGLLLMQTHIKYLKVYVGTPVQDKTIDL